MPRKRKQEKKLAEFLSQSNYYYHFYSIYTGASRCERRKKSHESHRCKINIAIANFRLTTSGKKNMTTMTTVFSKHNWIYDVLCAELRENFSRHFLFFFFALSPALDFWWHFFRFLTFYEKKSPWKCTQHWWFPFTTNEQLLLVGPSR